MAREALESRRILGAIQDGSREFISLLACVCADGSSIPPALIYKGESNDLRDSWVEDVDASDEVYFAASSNGWSSHAHGQDWLEKIFNRHTAKKAGLRRRILLVDGHSSHVNLQFLDWADSHRIIVIVLPPHSTHRLQPLDVGLFSPLAKAYSQELDTIIHQSYGMTSMTKRLFWCAFRKAWLKSFTPTNIISSFDKPGIWPVSPKMVAILQRPITPPEASKESLSTPKTARGIRAFQKEARKTHKTQEVRQILRINDYLLAQSIRDAKEKTQLCAAIAVEKKKRSRSKRLNLVGKEDSGPQFFSPGRIQAAKEFQALKDDEKDAEKIEKALKKVEAEALRQQKEFEKKNRAEKRKESREANIVAKALDRAQKDAHKQLKQEEKQANDQRKAASKQSKRKSPVCKSYTGIEGEQDHSKKRKLMTEADNRSKEPKKRIKSSQTRKTIRPEAHPCPRTREFIESHSQSPTNQDCPQTGVVTNSRGRRIIVPQRFNI
jgi:hypothetical protein